jgi:hypothetical protein
MPEPFEAWFSRFESEFLRYTGTPWSQHQGELEEVLHCHTSGLSPEATALDLFSASQPAPANLSQCQTASLSPPTKPSPTTR